MEYFCLWFFLIFFFIFNKLNTTTARKGRKSKKKKTEKLADIKRWKSGEKNVGTIFYAVCNLYYTIFFYSKVSIVVIFTIGYIFFVLYKVKVDLLYAVTGDNIDKNLCFYIIYYIYILSNQKTTRDFLLLQSPVTLNAHVNIK